MVPHLFHGQHGPVPRWGDDSQHTHLVQNRLHRRRHLLDYLAGAAGVAAATGAAFLSAL